MKKFMFLYILFALMHLVWLTNVYLLENEWNGIAMWLSTGLFIAGTAFYLVNRKSKEDE